MFASWRLGGLITYGSVMKLIAGYEIGEVESDGRGLGGLAISEVGRKDGWKELNPEGHTP